MGDVAKKILTSGAVTVGGDNVISVFNKTIPNSDFLRYKYISLFVTVSSITGNSDVPATGYNIVQHASADNNQPFYVDGIVHGTAPAGNRSITSQLVLPHVRVDIGNNSPTAADTLSFQYVVLLHN